IADIVDRTIDLEDYHILAFPGGFSAADYLGAGKFYAMKMKTLIGEELERFVGAEKLVIGICNGFQILTKYPLLPTPVSEQTVSVTHNESARFEDRWVYIRMNSDSPCVFTKGLEMMHLPCRHGEGRVVPLNTQILDSLRENNQIVARYAHGDGTPANGEYPVNPNGSVEDIVGICDTSGRIFGWMPHPEAFMYFTNDSHWTVRREELKRKKKQIPKAGEGLQIFRNAVDHVKESF
ncbi:MAG: phosphoribosylformylglycinamidine synthase subunit PurQ, partial [Thermoplasmata archaeon]|nr:phosphoribosylformylglycinamidine synthase subunit PurQ [Thermoplasmata archaeon]